MKVFDLFPFFNEADLLHLRVSELDPVVTDYGFSELPRTFTDLPKPMWLVHNWSKYQNGEHRFHNYQYVAIPSGPHPTVDWFQRRSLGSLIAGAEPDDIIMLSDVDEIPNRETVRNVIACKYDYPVVLRMKLYYHRVDLLDDAPWLGTVIAPRRCLGADPDMQELRENRGSFPVIDNGGWHFSWLGDGKAIADKLKAVDIERENQIYGSFGIKEPPKDPEFLESCYREGVDLFRRERPKRQIDILPGTFHPHEIAAWLAKYPKYARTMQEYR